MAPHVRKLGFVHFEEVFQGDDQLFMQDWR